MKNRSISRDDLMEILGEVEERYITENEPLYTVEKTIKKRGAKLLAVVLPAAVLLITAAVIGVAAATYAPETQNLQENLTATEVTDVVSAEQTDLTPELTTASETNSTIISTPILEDNTEPEHHDPPFQLTFNTWDEYQEFYSMSEKSDREIDTYLKANCFFSNGITNEKDIEKYKGIIDSLYIILPKVDSLKLRMMIFYIDYGYLHISYANGDGSTSLSYDDCFYCYAWPDANDNAPTPESDISIMIDDYIFYRMKENQKVFFGTVNEQIIGIEYCGNHIQNASDMLHDCFEIKKISDIFQDEK